MLMILLMSNKAQEECPKETILPLELLKSFLTSRVSLQISNKLN